MTLLKYYGEDDMRVINTENGALPKAEQPPLLFRLAARRNGGPHFGQRYRSSTSTGVFAREQHGVN